MHPIRIYLDSSDFSKFSEIQKQPPEYRQVLEYLIRKRDDGVIKMYFSEAHVVEAAPTAPKSIPEALERFRTIKNLCGKNSLIHPIDLWSTELSAPAGEPRSDTSVVRSDGTWMPKLVNLLEIIPDVDQVVADEISKLSRVDRRKYLRNNKPTPRAYSEMRKFYSGDADDIAKRLPLTARSVRVLERYFLGQDSRNNAINAVQDSLVDLESFGHWYEKDWAAASDLSMHLRRSGEEFKTKILEAREQFSRLAEDLIVAGEDSRKIQTLFKRTFQEVLAGSSNRIAKGIAHSMGVISELTDDSWKTAPGTTSSITLAMHVARRTVLGRTPSHSDFPDCYHAVYLPYVDIYRPDGFMASVLNECKLPLSTVIVEKLLQLPSAIEKMLDARGRDNKEFSDKAIDDHPSIS